MDALQTDGWPARTIAGFWRRLGAFIIDLILLGIVGMVLGWLFFDPLARMGAYARLIGFAMALAYFGIFNSRIGGGQTLAKRWLGIRVVDANDQLLSLPRSLLRYAVLGIPFFCNGLPIVPGMTISSPLIYLLGLVVFGGMLATIYLYIFNRRTRQSLHDLAVGSYVERFDRVGQATTFPGMWRGHLVVVALLAVLALSSPLVASRFANTKAFAGMLVMLKILTAQPHVMTAQVMRNTLWFNGNVSRTMQSVIRLDVPLIDDDAMAKRFAQQVAKADPDLAKEDDVVVTLVYGYDMGIASGWKRHGYTFRPEELR